MASVRVRSAHPCRPGLRVGSCPLKERPPESWPAYNWIRKHTRPTRGATEPSQRHSIGNSGHSHRPHLAHTDNPIASLTDRMPLQTCLLPQAARRPALQQPAAHQPHTGGRVPLHVRHWLGHCRPLPQPDAPGPAVPVPRRVYFRALGRPCVEGAGGGAGAAAGVSGAEAQAAGAGHHACVALSGLRRPVVMHCVRVAPPQGVRVPHRARSQ